MKAITNQLEYADYVKRLMEVSSEDCESFLVSAEAYEKYVKYIAENSVTLAEIEKSYECISKMRGKIILGSKKVKKSSREVQVSANWYKINDKC